jgi:hypothetical protein
MKIATVLARHRRLLAFGGLSLLVHVLVLEWIAVRIQPPARPPFAHGLAVRLRPAAALPVAASPATAVATPLAAAAAPPPATRPAADAPAVAAAPAAPGHAPAPARAASAASVIAADQQAQASGPYRIVMPPAALLTYDQTSSRPGQADTALGQARIAWQTEGDNYWLRVDGVLGKLASEGAGSAAGIAPRAALEERGDGGPALTRFDARQIVFDLAGRSLPAAAGVQDRASVLMQLAGMGLAEPDQISGVIDIVVAGAADAAVARFQVLGREDVATGLGPTAAWHLVELVAPGEPRLELWLAPERSWYPVQLRVTAADGSASTQVLARIDAAPSGY